MVLIQVLPKDYYVLNVSVDALKRKICKQQIAVHHPNAMQTRIRESGFYPLQPQQTQES